MIHEENLVLLNAYSIEFLEGYLTEMKEFELEYKIENKTPSRLDLEHYLDERKGKNCLLENIFLGF